MNNNTNLPFSEIDIPPETRMPRKTASAPSKKADKKDVEDLEKVNQIARKNFLTKSGLKLLIYILSAMIFLVIVDTVVVNFGLNSSNHLETVIEFGKYTATILLGSLFTTKINEND